MLGQLELCLRHPRSPEEYQRVMEHVRVQSKELARIVESLLFLARADSAEMQPNCEPIELTNWLETQAKHWSDHPRAADLHLQIEAARPISVHVQPVLLSQLLDNLVDNAFKYSPEGSRVDVCLAVPNGKAIISVIDRGDGIPPADLPHVFEPFFRSDDAVRRGTGGMGLGLAVASRIARSFSGELTVQSQPGAGSRFELALPVDEASGHR
jgi:signal transduction histidine kinase